MLTVCCVSSWKVGFFVERTDYVACLTINGLTSWQPPIQSFNGYHNLLSDPPANVVFPIYDAQSQQKAITLWAENQNVPSSILLAKLFNTKTAFKRLMSRSEACLNRAYTEHCVNKPLSGWLFLSVNTRFYFWIYELSYYTFPCLFPTKGIFLNTFASLLSLFMGAMLYHKNCSTAEITKEIVSIKINNCQFTFALSYIS